MSFPHQQPNFYPNCGSYYVPQHPSQYPSQYPPQTQYQTQPNFQIVIPPPPQYPLYPPYPVQHHLQQDLPTSSSNAPMVSHDHQSRILRDVQPNTPRQQVQSKSQPQITTVQEPIDYTVLLLTLADEYLDVAHALPDRNDEYYKLVATALGCLESVLNNFKLQPVREAQVSLKYAQTLLDETENYDNAEQVLTRSIELCDRNKLVDLKYASQSLLAQILHRSRPKAALKDVQRMIEDVEVFHHTAWEYCFRFLHASLSISPATTHDAHSAISQYEKIRTVAHLNGDYAVFAFAAIMEALLHLRSNTTDSATYARRSLASARQLQLNPEVAENPQMQVMMEFIDLSCSLWESNLAEMEIKVKSMQQSLSRTLEKPGWNDSGVLAIPISKRALNNVALQDGGLVSEKGGKFSLTMAWVTKNDIEILSFLLSAASVAHKNGADGGKAETLIYGALDRLRTGSLEEGYLTRFPPGSESLEVWRKMLECHLLLELVFLLCARGSWTLAKETLEEAIKVERTLGKSLAPEQKCLIRYLTGVIEQGTGNIRKALAIFQSANFALSSAKLTPDSSEKKSGRPNSRHSDGHNETIRDISLLAAMNAALIVHLPTHPEHKSFAIMHKTLESSIKASPNKNVQASYSLLQAVLAGTMLNQKQFLGNALKTAQLVGNAQITALALILMSERFFKDMVGDQAAKCAKAASHQARRAGDPLWMAVAADLEGESLRVQGKTDDARKMREDAGRVGEGLPARVREGFSKE